MRHQRFACAHLSDTHLTFSTNAFSTVAHYHAFFNAAALGGLKPAPAGRLREAILPSLAQFHREYSVFVAHINLSPFCGDYITRI